MENKIEIGEDASHRAVGASSCRKTTERRRSDDGQHPVGRAASRLFFSRSFGGVCSIVFGGCCGDRLFWRGGSLFRRRSLVWQLVLCLTVARRVWFLLFRRRSLVWQLALCLAVARRVRFLSAAASATSFYRVVGMSCSLHLELAAQPLDELGELELS